MFTRLSISKRFYKLLATSKKNLFYPNSICKYSSVGNINKKSLENYLDSLQREYQGMTTRNNLDARKKIRVKEIKPIIQVKQERDNLTEHLKALDDMLKEEGKSDAEMKKMVEKEKGECSSKLEVVQRELIEMLVPIDPRNLCDSIVLEINAGVGGQEAMLFANELFDMYINYALYKGWDSQVVDFDSTDLGGLRHAAMFITGAEVFRYFRYEAGVHRVQRIPATESSGRVHTSTVSVTALPQPNDIDLTILDKDLRIDTKRASGAGGQHVNTTDSAIRIVHIPTNTIVECQVDRSQIKNKEIAMQKLKAILYEKQMNAQVAENDAIRKSQVRSNQRNEKIRTYNFSQDRITDHRLQSANLHNLKGFLMGKEQLDVLINKLHDEAQYQVLKQMVDTREAAAKKQ